MPTFKTLARQALPGPYGAARHMKQRVEYAWWKQRVERSVRAITAEHGLVVQRGPFQGMRYTQAYLDTFLTRWGTDTAFFPKLLGCYEAELYPALEQVLTEHPRAVINIGAAEGYYSIGLALRLPEAHIYAFELAEFQQRLCADLAETNGVAERISQHGGCTRDTLAPLLKDAPFIFCDCEGYELELLQPDLLPELQRCDLLVELHDVKIPGLSQSLLSRFAATHEQTVIQATTRIPTQYPSLASLSASDQQFALSEGRRGLQDWVFLKARQPA